MIAALPELQLRALLRLTDDTRPGYGYKGVVDPGVDQLHPANEGIHAIDLDTGEWRCDLNPRWSRDVCIDSMHEGNQRQIYLLDVSEMRKN